MSALLAEVDVHVDSVCCPGCGTCLAESISVVSVAEHKVFTCDHCDLTFIWPRVEQDFSGLSPEAYYNDWELLDYAGASFLLADVVVAQGRRRGSQSDGVEHPPSILEAGCGVGHVLVHFRAHGWTVRGTDPWASVTAIGRKYFRLEIETARMEDANIPPESQDVVLSVDVLQFVADPRAFLNACMRALKPGGLLYLTIPNFDSRERQREKWNWRHFLPHSYINYFSAASIQRIVEDANFFRTAVNAFGGPDGDGFLRVVARRRPVDTGLIWSDLSSDPNDSDLPPLDRRDVEETTLSPEQRTWRENGFLVVPSLIPYELIERYCNVRKEVSHQQGWTSCTPYLEVPEVRDLCLYKPLVELLEHLLGEPMGLHLNLTGWVSTERDWHQDDYLNPPIVNGHYAAVWTALDRISPDSGPFEFVPGSHRWPIIRQAKVLEKLGYDNGDDPSWPWESERLLTPFFEREIRNTGLPVQRFLANKGDVLIWHARLVHRGSLPQRPGAERRAMIAHYSAVSRRNDMPRVQRHSTGGLYFLQERDDQGAQTKPRLYRLVKAVPALRNLAVKLKHLFS